MSIGIENTIFLLSLTYEFDSWDLIRNDQIEAISTKLPVDKAELKKFFPK